MEIPLDQSIEYDQTTPVTPPLKIKPECLVLSGGGMAGIEFLGCIQKLIDNSELNIDRCDTFIGTSVGALISYLTVLGLKPDEIISLIIKTKLIDRLKYVNVVSVYNGQGAVSYSKINDELEKVTIERLGFLPTFKQLHSRTGKLLTMVTFNLTTGKTEYLSTVTKPDLPCLIGLRMACNLPMIFEDFKYMNSYWIDGGVTENFPLRYASQKYGSTHRIIGITTAHETCTYKDEAPSRNMMRYIGSLFLYMVNSKNIIPLELYRKHHIYKIVSTVNNTLASLRNKTELLDNFSKGYRTERYIPSRKQQVVGRDDTIDDVSQSAVTQTDVG